MVNGPQWLLYHNKYLTKLVFSVRIVNYGPLFFPFYLWPARFALGHKSNGKNAGRNLQYGPRTRLVRSMYWVLRISDKSVVSVKRTFKQGHRDLIHYTFN